MSIEAHTQDKARCKATGDKLCKELLIDVQDSKGIYREAIQNIYIMIQEEFNPDGAEQGLPSSMQTVKQRCEMVFCDMQPLVQAWVQESLDLDVPLHINKCKELLNEAGAIGVLNYAWRTTVGGGDISLDEIDKELSLIPTGCNNMLRAHFTLLRNMATTHKLLCQEWKVDQAGSWFDCLSHAANDGSQHNLDFLRLSYMSGGIACWKSTKDAATALKGFLSKMDAEHEKPICKSKARELCDASVHRPRHLMKNLPFCSQVNLTSKVLKHVAREVEQIET